MFKAKPFDEFGGWLRCFQIANWIGLAICAVAIPMFALGLLYQFVEPNAKDGWEAFVALIDASASLYLTRLILKKLVARDPAAPKEIRRLLLISMGLALAVLAADGVIMACFGAWPPVGDDAGTMRMDGKSVQWALIWYFYFGNSRRVKAYYAAAEAPVSPATG